MPKTKQAEPTLRPFVAGAPAKSVDVQAATYAEADTFHVTLHSDRYSFPKEFDLTERAARRLIEQLSEALG